MKLRIGDRTTAAPRHTRAAAPPAGSTPAERQLAAARLLARLAQCRDWAPDADRATHLAVLRREVTSGTYRVDHERTARAILGQIAGGVL
jgi:anti-sigma28 factor (negative regulator of flagellin synthesis)